VATKAPPRKWIKATGCGGMRTELPAISCQFILDRLEDVNLEDVTLKEGDRYSKPTTLDHNGIHKIPAICVDIVQ
jgi:hypothetical protein